MAKSEFTINFNYNKAIGKAADLEAAAAKLKTSAVDKLETVINAINRDWEGENAEAYTAKCNREKSKLNATVVQMEQVAKAIRQIAEKVKKAEMKALMLARAAAAAAAANK